MRNHTRPLLAGSALIALALAGCGTGAMTSTTSTPKPAASTPAAKATPVTAAAAPAGSVPVLHTGKTVTISMPVGPGASGQPQTDTETWTLNSVTLETPSNTSGTILVFNVTIKNLGPLPISGSNALLGYTDWYFDSRSHQVTADSTGYGSAYSTAPQIPDVSALGAGQSTTGEFGLYGGPWHTAGAYGVMQGDGSTPVMVVDPQHLITSATCTTAASSCQL